MWCDSELHYSMLEKACMDGNTTMAECLIELGAYINRKTKTDSLIYQVGLKILAQHLITSTVVV